MPKALKIVWWSRWFKQRPVMRWRCVLIFNGCAPALRPDAGRRNPQLGVALLQVLLLTAIIALLAIQMTRTSRTQVHLATALDERIRADLNSRSILNRFIYAQLTEVDGGLGRKGAIPIDLANLPVDGTIQKSGPVTLSAQDINGLLPFQFTLHPFWSKYLVALGVSTSEADTLLAEFADMQDVNLDAENGNSEPKLSAAGVTYPNRAFQDYTVLESTTALSTEQKAQIRSSSHLYNTFAVNLAAMPPTLASALIAGEADDSDSEKAPVVDMDRFAEALNQEMSVDLVNYARGPIVRFKLEWLEGGVTLRQSWDIRITGGVEAPFAVLRYAYE
jgi:hypothetical protein